MIDAKITETRYYDEYGTKKVALLEKQQEVKILCKENGLPNLREDGYYLCKVTNPSDESKNYGVKNNQLVKVYPEYLEVA